MSSPTAERDFPAGDGFWRHFSWWYVGGAVITTTIAWIIFFAIGPFPVGFATVWIVFVYSNWRASQEDEADEKALTAAAEAGRIYPAGLDDQPVRDSTSKEKTSPSNSSTRWKDEALFSVALSVTFLGAGMALLAWSHPETLALGTATGVFLWSLAATGAGLLLLLAGRWIASRRDRDVSQ